MRRFEFRVCSVQHGKVLWVNGQWNGVTPFDGADTQKSLNACPEVWKYLNTCGPEGWQMVGTSPLAAEGNACFLYLQREI